MKCDLCGWKGQNDGALQAHVDRWHPLKFEYKAPAARPHVEERDRHARLYMRVSTDDQTNANQYLKAKAAIDLKGWTRVTTYEDKDSGAKVNPGLRTLLAELQAGDVLVVTRADRLSRSLSQFVTLTQMVHARGAEIFCTEQPVDTTSAMGMAFWQVLGVFAELERALIVQRTKDGMERARKEGRFLGRHRAGCGVAFPCPEGVVHKDLTGVDARAHDRGITRERKRARDRERMRRNRERERLLKRGSQNGDTLSGRR